MKLFTLKKIQAGDFKGKKYRYEVYDQDGKKIGGTSDNRDFVACIVGKHKTVQQGDVFSTSQYTGELRNLGKGSTLAEIGDEVYGFAIIETVLGNTTGNRYTVMRSPDGKGRPGSEIQLRDLKQPFFDVVAKCYEAVKLELEPPIDRVLNS